MHSEQKVQVSDTTKDEQRTDAGNLKTTIIKPENTTTKFSKRC